MKNKKIGLDIACLDDGEIYLGEVKEGHKKFRKGSSTCVTEKVLNAVANYMSLHIEDEDVPEYVLDVTDKDSKRKAVLTFRVVCDREDVMYR